MVTTSSGMNSGKGCGCVPLDEQAEHDGDADRARDRQRPVQSRVDRERPHHVGAD
jgi:hypothetical protein